MFESKKNNIHFQIGNDLTANTSSTMLIVGGGKESLFGVNFGLSDTKKHFKLTLTKFVGGVVSVSEVVKVRGKSGNILTIVRAYEPCPLNANATVMTQAPQVFNIGDIASMNMTASDLIELGALIDTKQNNCVMVSKSANYTFTGSEINNTGFSTITTSGNITYTLNPALFPTTNGMYEFTFCKSTNDVNTVIIDVGSGKTIDTAQTYTLTSFMESVTIRIASNIFAKVIATSNRPIDLDINLLSEDVTGNIENDFFVKNNGTGSNTKIKVSRYMATNGEATTGTNETKFINPKQAKDNYAFHILTASNNLKASSDGVVGVNFGGGTLYKVKEIVMGGVYGNISVSYDARTLNVAWGGLSNIFINGVAVGTQRSITSTTFVSYTEDFTVKAGDLVQLYARGSSSGNIEVRNFRLSYDRVNFTADFNVLI